MRALAALAVAALGASCAPPRTTACAPAPASATALAPPAAPGATALSVDEAWARLCDGPEAIPMEVAGSRELAMLDVGGSDTLQAARVVLDTGGNTTGILIRRSAATKLGIARAESAPRSIRLGGHAIELPEGTGWAIWDDDDEEAKHDAAVRKEVYVGQIGSAFLSRFIVCIDPAKGRLGLGDPRRYFVRAGAAPSIPLLMQRTFPFVHVLLRENGAFAAGYGMLLDTGATTSMLERPKIDFLKHAHPAWPLAKGAFGDADMIGGPWPEEVLAVPDVALHALGSPVESAVDLGAARFVERPDETWEHMFGGLPETGGSYGAIANDVLLRHRLLIDYPHARLFVQPSGRAADASASASRVGVAVRFGADGCPEIRQITDTNAKETTAKLAAGDVILSVDGKDACQMWHHELEAALAGPPATTKALRVRRASSTFDVQVATAQLL